MAISTQDVFNAADTIVSQGGKPTLAAIRAALGGGSFTTISPALQQWKETQRAEDAVAPIFDPAPPELAEEVRFFAQKIWDTSMRLANSRLVSDREAMEQVRVSLEAERDEAAELADLVSGDLDASQTEARELAEKLQSASQREADANARVASLETANSDLKTQVSRLNGELTTASASVQACQARLESAAREVTKAENAADSARKAAKQSGEEAAELRGRVSELEKQLSKRS